MRSWDRCRKYREYCPRCRPSARARPPAIRAGRRISLPPRRGRCARPSSCRACRYSRRSRPRLPARRRRIVRSAASDPFRRTRWLHPIPCVSRPARSSRSCRRLRHRVPRCTAAKRRGWHRGSGGIAARDPQAGRAGAPCSRDKGRCGNCGSTCRGRPRDASARPPCRDRRPASTASSYTRRPRLPASPQDWSTAGGGDRRGIYKPIHRPGRDAACRSCRLR